jgi:hypothetical protein
VQRNAEIARDGLVARACADRREYVELAWSEQHSSSTVGELFEATRTQVDDGLGNTAYRRITGRSLQCCFDLLRRSRAIEQDNVR